MIEIKNLTKKYGNFTALNNVSLSINDNECFTLLGFNGAGKTTLINVLTTLLNFDSGEVIINGFNLKENSFEVKKLINVAPQEIAVCKNLTVYENLNLIAELYNVIDKEEKIASTINEFGLNEKTNVLAKKLSGGQLKRLSIALAVLTNPKILFLDEPTLGLDVKARRNLWEIIKTLKKDRIIFLTTHYLEEVENLTDKVAIISKGKIKAVGTTQEIIKSSNCNNLEDAFIAFAEEEV